MKKLTISLLAALLVTLVATSAFANTYAVDVISSMGSGVTDPARMIDDNALGAPDGVFFSLGQGGIAAFDFGVEFDTTASVFEITNGNRAGYPEYADIFVGSVFSLNPGDYTFISTISNSLSETLVDLTGVLGSPFRYLLMMDVTGREGGITSGDGFDLDAVSVKATPIPGAVWLLGSGLFGLIGIRRRMRKS